MIPTYKTTSQPIQHNINCHRHRKYAYSSKPSKITSNILAQLAHIKTKIAAKITEIT
jgi:predicted transglutaminase-like cysteine proteinase